MTWGGDFEPFSWLRLGHTRLCKDAGCGGIFLTVEAVISLAGAAAVAKGNRQTAIPLHYRGGFVCPRCQGQTKIIRTRPHTFSDSTTYTRACKNAQCGQIFTTHETVARVLELTGNPQPVRIIVGAMSNLSPAQLAELKTTVANF